MRSLASSVVSVMPISAQRDAVVDGLWACPLQQELERTNGRMVGMELTVEQRNLLTRLPPLSGGPVTVSSI